MGPEKEKSGDPPKPLPEQIRKAWENAGAGSGWMIRDQSGFWYYERFHEEKAGDVPAFVWVHWQAGIMAKLPVPQERFGLNCKDNEITDAGLKEVAAYKQLQALDLFGTKVTDTGIKHLVGLKHLQSLNLAFTKVT